MSGRLHVTLDAGASSETVAAAEVISGGTAGLQTMPLQAGEARAMELPEGLYLVRATLPSGEMASATTEVRRDGDAHVTLSFPAAETDRDPDPHESLTTVELWARLWAGELTAAWQPDEVRAEPSRYVARLSMAPGSYGVQVGGSHTAWRIVLLPPSYESTITVAVDPSGADFCDGVRVTVRGSSAAADAMLGFLTSGQLDEARTLAPDLVDQAVRMFETKVASPEGAAAAGYFLLRVGRQESIGNWPANFASWFGWLPDARVIHACQLLRRPGVPERDLARAGLVAAARAGVPRYTEGLRLLYQGLRTFAAADPEDGEVGQALAGIEPYAAACDWTAAMTTYWAVRPDAPTLTRRTGLPADPDGWARFELEAGEPA